MIKTSCECITMYTDDCFGEISIIVKHHNTKVYFLCVAVCHVHVYWKPHQTRGLATRAVLGVSLCILVHTPPPLSVAVAPVKGRLSTMADKNSMLHHDVPLGKTRSHYSGANQSEFIQTAYQFFHVTGLLTAAVVLYQIT